MGRLAKKPAKIAKGKFGMTYISTRNKKRRVSSAEAILSGISQEGGLYVPEKIPRFNDKDLKALPNMDYCKTACKILSLFLTDFTHEEIRLAVNKAYVSSNPTDENTITQGNIDKFYTENKIALSRLDPSTYLLELWHGPTAAFKDMALQLLPHLMSTAATKQEEQALQTVILVATSGDTGKAAMEGFKDVSGVKMVVLYPEDGVSPMQKQQMATQEGSNIQVLAIEGNFDDAQTTVKELFSDKTLIQKMADQSKVFSSANSINWGRLVPQIIYYFAAYGQLCKEEEITIGEIVDIVVPTGNFGNILAAWYAKEMGLPLGTLICASNQNNILTDFLESGCYDKRREFYQTISPSMDILVSSNLERLLFLLSDKDDKQVAQWMEQLSSDQKYTVSKEVFALLKKTFIGGSCSDEETKKVIRDLYDSCGYLCDPHTAVALSVGSKNTTGRKQMILSTASPYKFPDSVLEALGEDVPRDSFDAMQKLFEKTSVEIPIPLRTLKGKPIVFEQRASKGNIKKAVAESILGVSTAQIQNPE